MKRIVFSLLLLAPLCGLRSQDDADRVHQLYTTALVENQGYEWLSGLTQIGGRLAGSPEADSAVAYFKVIADSLGYQSTLQPVKVPHWVRGEEVEGYYLKGDEKITVNWCALGGSVATPAEGIQAPVVEIRSFEQLDSLPNDGLKGKIAFFNIRMDPSLINTFFAYGRAGKQRRVGALEASRKGAEAVITRSLSATINKLPHTGAMTYVGAERKIPAISISTYDAEQLQRDLQEDPELNYFMKVNSAWRDSVISHNLIVDIPGSEVSDEYIVVSGHLDSWDLGDGAQDDGAGCSQALDAAWLLEKNGMLPKRNLRVVFYMNEEFGLDGAKVYARKARENGIRHAIAMESDAGGYSPRGFSISAEDSIIEAIRNLRHLLEPYGLHRFSKGGAGADIGQLQGEGTVLVGLAPDNHRYFEIHHTKGDVLAAVNPRELEMGSASLAALIYLMDKYDITARGNTP